MLQLFWVQEVLNNIWPISSKGSKADVAVALHESGYILWNQFDVPAFDLEYLRRGDDWNRIKTLWWVWTTKTEKCNETIYSYDVLTELFLKMIIYYFR